MGVIGVPVEVPATFARGDVLNRDVAMPGGEQFNVGPVQPVAGGPRVVDELDGLVVSLVAQGAEHRQHRRDAAAATDQDEALGARVGERERALRGAEVKYGPGLAFALQMARDQTLGVGRDGQLE